MKHLKTFETYSSDTQLEYMEKDDLDALLKNHIGIGLDDAEKILGKSIDEWTKEDLEKLRIRAARSRKLKGERAPKQTPMPTSIPKLSEEDFLKKQERRAREAERNQRRREEEFYKKHKF